MEVGPLGPIGQPRIVEIVERSANGFWMPEKHIGHVRIEASKYWLTVTDVKTGATGYITPVTNTYEVPPYSLVDSESWRIFDGAFELLRVHKRLPEALAIAVSLVPATYTGR